MSTINQGLHLTKKISGFTVAYDDLGEGYPVIFLHGFPFNKSMWSEQHIMAQYNIRIIAPDLRGFGNSHDDSYELSMDLFADDLIELMNVLLLEKVAVCGLSMGGYIALNAIKRYPKRFSALILCDTQCNTDTEEGKAKRYKSIEFIKSNGLSDFTETFIKNALHPASFSQKPELVTNLMKMMLSNSENAYTRGLKSLAERKETCSNLDQIDVPALVICGSDDSLTPVSKSQYLHEQIIGSRISIIQNAGHISNMEQPEIYNQILLDFIKTQTA